jgi:membrane protease YdiL (CAAX protease family)
MERRTMDFVTPKEFRATVGDLKVAEVPEAIASVAEPIAPWWHTALVLTQLIALALIGFIASRTRSTQSRGVMYTGIVMWQALQLSAVISGIYHRQKFFLRTLLGGLGTAWSEIWRGAALYLATMIMFVVVTVAFHLMRLRPELDHQALYARVPANAAQLAIWFGICVVIGFCEEHVFRGYLLQQMIAWGASLGLSRLVAVSGAIGLTSVLFGSLHVYEGMRGAILIGLLGMMYAAVALWRGNLRAVIVAHVLQDFLAMALLMTSHGRGER